MQILRQLTTTSFSSSIAPALFRSPATRAPSAAASGARPRADPSQAAAVSRRDDGGQLKLGGDRVVDRDGAKRQLTPAAEAATTAHSAASAVPAASSLVWPPLAACAVVGPDLEGNDTLTQGRNRAVERDRGRDALVEAEPAQPTHARTRAS